MEFKPHGYQTKAIEYIYAHDKCGLFLDMGLGKTVTTLTALNELKYGRFQINRILIIAPKKVAESTWSKESDKWDHTKHLRISKILGSAKKRLQALYTPADLYIINRENVCWLVDLLKNDWFFDTVVIDESSSFKSHKAKRWKALRDISPHIKRLISLTGTPSPNGIEDLWAQIYLLDGGARLEKSYTRFRDRYLNPGKRGLDGMVYSWTVKDGAYDTVLSKISDVCISMKAADYLDLPDIVYCDTPVALDDKSAKAYKELERNYILSLPDDDISVASAAALSNKLLQLANGAVYDERHSIHSVHDCKLEMLEETIESLSGQHALIFYNFVSDKSRILTLLNKNPKLRVRVLSSTANEDAWNRGEVDILLAHPQSCAYGLNLQSGGHHIIWFGLTWNYELYVQANARLYRQGQTDKVFVHHLISEGTRDEDVLLALSRKDDAQKYVIDTLKARIEAVKKEAKHIGKR